MGMRCSTHMKGERSYSKRKGKKASRRKMKEGRRRKEREENSEK